MHRKVVFLVFGAYCAAAAQSRTAAVPYVGCKSESFVEGPLEAPSGQAKEIRISPATAQRLAYYEAAIAPGVIAPRGWNCIGFLGSAGATVEISPRPIAQEGADLSGPLVVMMTRRAETSGRFDVATIIARVFPAHRDFVTRLLAEEPQPNLSFAAGPYPKDKVSYKSTEAIEYETPAQTDGLGTYPGLKKNADPIRGAAVLLPPAQDLALLAVRLPAELRDLSSAIVQQFHSSAGK